MASTTHGLWPDDLISDGPKLPVTILQEQAAALAEKTKNLLRGEVKTTPDDEGGFVHRFYLRADVLDGYSYLLLIVSHGVTSYPAAVRDPSKTMGDSWITLLGMVDGVPAWKNCESSDELEDALRAFFVSDNTKRIVQSLWQQSKAAKYSHRSTVTH